MDSGYPEYTFFNIPHGTDVAELARKHNMEHKWYQIYTQVNAEKKLYNKIQAYGFQAFLPIRILKRQWSDRVKTIEEPAFKSYIFAKLNYNEMRCVERLSQFCYYVSYGGSINSTGENSDRIYPYITDKTVEQIEQILIEHPHATMEDNKLFKGDKITITEGSLKNYQGNLLSDPSGKKVAIKLHGMKQSLVISVPTVLLKKIA
ncbi:MAG: hypothetical protein HRT37_25400 [Alteromonadaceae bacterium]|nr:hypothetical protein [Alteromonadaceae bacterium]